MKHIKLDALLTLQLRPHVLAMLETLETRIRERVPENVRAKATRSRIVRMLLARDNPSTQALVYVGNRRYRDNAAVSLRVRCSQGEHDAINARAQALNVTTARLVAAIIVDAAYPSGNFPVNPDTINLGETQ